MQPRALDRWNEARPSADLLYGECALGLGARSLIHSSFGASVPHGERFQLSFFRAGLPAELWARLHGHPDLSLTPDAEQPARVRLVGPLECLSNLSKEHKSLACLLAAQQAAARPVQEPMVMGILNTTPDSFSDGGSWNSEASALERASAMLAAGVDIIDVGGESTRPGSEPVSEAEEIRRTEPIVRALAARFQIPISIDTTKAGVARAAILAGASMVNDISAGRFDSKMLGLVAESEVDLVLMHIQKTPKDMQQDPSYSDPVSAVSEHLRERVNAALKLGIDPRRMAIDPGIGFGKRLNDNILLMRSIAELRSLGLPVLVGSSRKSMLAELSNESDPARRDAETLAAQCFAQLQGAEIHRVHAVRECVAALKVSVALGGFGPWALGSTARGSAE